MSRPNILLIGIDALRVKNLSCYGYKRPTTPNIDKLAHRGMLFKKAFSVGNQTVPSLIAIFSGCYIGPRNNMWKYDNEWVKLFKKHGYKTFYVGIQSMACYSPLDKILSSFEIRVNAVTNKYPCLKKVMDKFRVGSLPHKIVRKIYETKREITFKKQMLTQCREDATKICNKATTTLGNIRQPFFLFLWFPDLHYPYNPPKEFVQYISKYKLPIKKNISTEEILEKLHISIYKNHIKWNILNDRYASDIINRYDGTLRYIDTQIGIILKSLSEKGLTDDTIIILMADHGESFIEHDIFFEHHGLYDVSIHVPLIIYNPDFCGRKTIDELVQTIDLFPTIAKMVNIDISKIRT
ncbi:MAG: sulfatase, partial [Candidatus Aenigmarchaeota archaeon]|nr:sulfatase [Candidatus Aenigmarchaeota archaeon]